MHSSSAVTNPNHDADDTKDEEQPTPPPSIEQNVEEYDDYKDYPYVINNNTIWKEPINPVDYRERKVVYASMGGHIAKFGEYYYWVGTDPRQEDSSNRIYRSATMGSKTWELVSVVESRPKPTGDTGPNIQPPNENTLVGKPQVCLIVLHSWISLS